MLRSLQHKYIQQPIFSCSRQPNTLFIITIEALKLNEADWTGLKTVSAAKAKFQPPWSVEGINQQRVREIRETLYFQGVACVGSGRRVQGFKAYRIATASYSHSRGKKSWAENQKGDQAL